MRYFFIAILFVMSFVSRETFAKGNLTSVPDYEYALDGRGSYNFAVMANHSLEIRLREVREAAPLTQAIKEACSKGVRVSVVLYIDGRDTASVLADTCAEIYLSYYQELSHGDVGLLLDREYLVVNGRPIAARNSLAREEFEFMRHQRRVSQRIQ
jgi:hypothetical protein